MARQLFAWRNGKFCEVTPETREQVSPFVQSDELPNLRHPVNGKRYTSRREYEKDTVAMGCRIVGNDWIGQPPPPKKEVMTEKMFVDAMEQAEAICSDPSKLRAQREENLERLARQRRHSNE